MAVEAGSRTAAGGHSVTLIDPARAEPAREPRSSEARGPSDFDRTPPQDVEAERSVLGAMLLSKDAIADVIEVIRPGDFYYPANQLIYDAVLDLYGRGEPADAITVSSELTRTGQLMRAGGGTYLHTLVSTVPTAANAGYYARIVAEKAVLRRLVTAGTRIVQMGYDSANGAIGVAGSIDDIVDRAQAEVYEVTERRASEDYIRIEDLLQSTWDELEQIMDRGGVGTGIPTGFARLDEITNGLHAGQMVTVAGRPGSGKSTLALDFARSAAVKHARPTVIFSLEMGKLEIMMRLLSAEASVPLASMRSGHMSDQDWQRMARRSGELAEAPLFIDDSPNLTMMEIRAKARRLKQRHDLQLIVIDYLQLMTSGKRVESRQQEVSEFSRAIKLLAKELEVPVIALSQLNRGPEQRTDKRPMLADLRESGSIEQDSDMVLLVHREDMYEPESARAGEADLIIAKHRNGPTATVAVAFQGRYSRFSDMPQ
ncbi:MAG: replicative DNA helicase [Actinobacteria bacterium]|nr:replicative DNA helicase [Actinomycetota bacterium]